MEWVAALKAIVSAGIPLPPGAPTHKPSVVSMKDVAEGRGIACGSDTAGAAGGGEGKKEADATAADKAAVLVDQKQREKTERMEAAKAMAAKAAATKAAEAAKAQEKKTAEAVVVAAKEALEKATSVKEAAAKANEEAEADAKQTKDAAAGIAEAGEKSEPAQGEKKKKKPPPPPPGALKAAGLDRTISL